MKSATRHITHADIGRMPAAIYLLSLCNACQYISASLLITVSALIGFELVDDKRLATLPLALQFLAIMATSVPASLFMGRFGRKPGFLLAGLIGIVGASIALLAIFVRDFRLYCLATLCFGSFTAFANYYRFTAADVVHPARRGQGISLVMAGGVLAAFIGPNLANWSAGLFASQRYAGPFATLIGVYLLAMTATAIARLPGPIPRYDGNRGRSLGALVRQPVFLVAVCCQMFGYGTMNLVMTSTPLAMQAHAFGLDDTALVIQWHVLAMFAPSFVTGRLIARFGIVTVLFTGVLFGIACVAVNLGGTSRVHFVAALVLLGLSWNLLFVGGTTLLTDTYRAEEKARTQAINDLLVFTTVAVTALCAGGMHYLFGWRLVNLAVLPMLLVTGAAVWWLSRLQRHTAATDAPPTGSEHS